MPKGKKSDDRISSRTSIVPSSKTVGSDLATLNTKTTSPNRQKSDKQPVPRPPIAGSTRITPTEDATEMIGDVTASSLLTGPSQTDDKRIKEGTVVVKDFQETAELKGLLTVLW